MTDFLQTFGGHCILHTILPNALYLQIVSGLHWFENQYSLMKIMNVIDLPKKLNMACCYCKCFS